ncbi:hypothetical protein BGZ76_009131, partial [Entomortierella beljakovae]
DKRLDEWVDIQRLKRLIAQQPVENSALKDSAPITTRKSATSASGSSNTLDSTKKRKVIKDEATLLMESLNSSSMRKSDTAQDTVVRNAGHGHDHDDEEVPRVRNVEWILYAGYDIATWYYSPFPEEYHDCQRLFICEYCLKYIRQVESFTSHTLNCKRKRPPGTVVYSNGINKIYKLDGKTNKLYCQNLSLLAKLFLDNKTLYFDIHGFQFFVLTETRQGDRADVPVGFFSKEIVSYDGYNLACILILPPFQRKSYGKLLIEFSYELTKIEGKVGSPEKPLSDLGKLGYMSYWITAILRELYPKPWPAKRIKLPLSNSRKKSKSSSTTKSSIPTESHQIEKVAGKEKGVAGSSGKGNRPEAVEEGVPESDAASHEPNMMGMENQVSSSNENESTNLDIAFSIRELAAKTGIVEEDLLETLVAMGWMTHWLSPADQNNLAPVKSAKRRHRKLLKFDEQQKLLVKFGGGHDSGVMMQQENLERENSPGYHHHLAPSKAHSRHYGNSPHGNPVLSSSSSSSEGQQAMDPSQQILTQDIDPVSILEIPASEGEEEDAEKTSIEQASTESLSSSRLQDVVVITLDMVKDYQDRHNIRLDPYLNWNGIDWVAYRSTLD